MPGYFVWIPIAFRAVANRDGHISRGDLADRNCNAGDLSNNKYFGDIGESNCNEGGGYRSCSASTHMYMPPRFCFHIAFHVKSSRRDRLMKFSKAQCRMYTTAGWQSPHYPANRLPDACYNPARCHGFSNGLAATTAKEKGAPSPRFD